MKSQMQYLKLILAASLVVQFGCSGSNKSNGQYLYPNIAGGTTTQDQSIAGNAFRTNTTGYGSSGVNDSWVQAANTFGLPDADQDGVSIPQDKCPNTPANTKVDSNGCTLAATGDGSNGSDPAVKSGDLKPTEPATFAVNMDEADRGSTGCSLDNNNDADGDGLSDKCEVDNKDTYSGLNKDVYNGFVISAVSLNKKDIPNAKKAKNIPVKKGDGADYSYDKKIIEYYLDQAQAAKESSQSRSDLRALKKLYSLGKEIFPYRYANTIELYKGWDKKFGLVSGIGSEAVPFGVESGAVSLANLSGIESSAINLSTDEGFLYIAETHVVMTKAQYDIQIASFVDSSNARAGSRAGMFFVLGNGNTEVLTTEMLETGKDNPVRRIKGSLKTLGKCNTVHMVIAFFADKKMNNDEIKNIFSENVIYKDDAGDWRVFSQDMLRTKPLGENCTYASDDTFFEIGDTLQGTAE